LIQSLQAVVLHERCAQDYNRFRTQRSLGCLTPEKFKNLPVADQRLILARSSKRKGFGPKEFWGHQRHAELARVN